MSNSYSIEQSLIGEGHTFVNRECPTFAEEGKAHQEWSFLERFPELGFVVRKNTVLAKQIDAHYQKVVEFVARYVAPHAIDIDREMFENPDYVPKELLEKACEY